MVYDDKFEQKFDVGIVGWWYYYNYGSILTYLALCKALESKGYSVLMIRKNGWKVRTGKPIARESYK